MWWRGHTAWRTVEIRSEIRVDKCCKGIRWVQIRSISVGVIVTLVALVTVIALVSPALRLLPRCHCIRVVTVLKTAAVMMSILMAETAATSATRVHHFNICTIESRRRKFDPSQYHRFVNRRAFRHLVVDAEARLECGLLMRAITYLMLSSSARSGISPDGRGNTRGLCGR